MSYVEEAESFNYLILSSVSWEDRDKIQNAGDVVSATMMKNMLRQYSKLKVGLFPVSFVINHLPLDT